ncbi:MAG: hypothetical protein ACRC1K_16575 [Planctomycetia bacterium]
MKPRKLLKIIDFTHADVRRLPPSAERLVGTAFPGKARTTKETPMSEEIDVKKKKKKKMGWLDRNLSETSSVVLCIIAFIIYVPAAIIGIIAVCTSERPESRQKGLVMIFGPLAILAAIFCFAAVVKLAAPPP